MGKESCFGAMGGRRLVWRLAVGAASLVFLPAISVDAASCQRSHETRQAGWTSIGPVPFSPTDKIYPWPAGQGSEVLDADRVVDFVAFADRPSLILATNGVSILRTTDGGCHWAEVYSTGLVSPEPPLRPYVETIGDLGAGLSGRSVYAMLRTPDAARPLIRSQDRGQTWTRVMAPEPKNDFAVLAVAPSDSEVLYLDSYQLNRPPCFISPADCEVMRRVPSIRSTYRSIDGGDSWELRRREIGGGEFLSLEIAVSPHDPDTYVELDNVSNHLAYSRDGGKTIRSIERNPALFATNTLQGIGEMAIHAPRESLLRIAISIGKSVYMTDDFGRTWTFRGEASYEEYLSGIAFDPQSGAVLMISNNGSESRLGKSSVLRLNGLRPPQRITPAGVDAWEAPFTGLRSVGGHAYMVREGSIFRLDRLAPL